MSIPVRLTRRALLAGAIAVVSGCSQVPTSGPITRVTQGDSADQPGIEITPAPPQPGASIEAVVYGFLAAMAVPDVEYSAAREYLTPQASREWNPKAGVTVYQGDGYAPTFTANGALLRAPVIGRVDSDGRFTPSYDVGQVTDFDVVQVNGQWRIGHPPEGLLISQFLFERYYQPRALYFVEPRHRRLAAELSFVSDSQASPTRSVLALLAGPGSWLASVWTTAVPEGMALGPTGVSVNDGVADVPLLGEVGELDDDAKLLLAAQILWTLSSFDEIAGVRVTVNGQPLQAPGADSTGVIDLADVAASRTQTMGASGDVIFIKDGVLEKLALDASEPVVVSGVFGTSVWRDRIDDLAVAVGENLVAVVPTDRKSVVWGPLEGAGSASVAISGTQLLAPQLLADGRVVTFDSANRLCWAGQGTTMITVETSGLPDGRITAFGVSPDGTRVAVIVQSGEQSQLGLICVLPGENPSVESWRRLYPVVNAGLLDGFRDVAWSGETSLVVLVTSSEVPSSTVYQMTCDGTNVTALGPSVEMGADRLAVQPQAGIPAIVVVDSQGRALRYEEGSRWVPFAAGVGALTLG